MQFLYESRQGLLRGNSSGHPDDLTDQWLATAAPGRQEGVRYHLNLVGPPGCGILNSGADLASDRLLQLLVMRPFLPNNGGVVLPNCLRGPAGDLLKYGHMKGFVSRKALRRVLWVEDYWSYLDLLGHLRRERVTVDFYQGSPVLGELFGKTFLQGWRATEIAAALSNKARFKCLVEKVSAQLEIPVNRYPRIVVDSRSSRDIADAVARLQQKGHRQLFAQGCIGAAGLRNLVIDLRSRTVVSPSGEVAFSNLDILAEVFRRLCPPEDETRSLFEDPEEDASQFLWELSPLLPIEKQRSFSYGLTVSPEGVIAVGPRYQLLGPERLDYRGFYASASNLPPDVEETGCTDLIKHQWSGVLEQAKRLALATGHRLLSAGYQGSCSIDFFVYPDNTARGGYALGVAEANVRRDGTSFLLSLLASIGDLSKYRAIQCLDHLEVPDASLPELMTRLERCHVPLLSRGNQRGAVLLTAPIASDGTNIVCAGFVEQSPTELRKLVASFERALNK